MDAEHRLTAAAWHDDNWSPLYAYAADGAVMPEIGHEIQQCLGYIERYHPHDDLDPIDEHRRLMALLRHVEPQVAADRARRLGWVEGCAAAIDWTHDHLEVPTAAHVTATARRLHHGLKANDPTTLDALPRSRVTSGTAERMELMIGWLEPDDDDQVAHTLWQSTRADLVVAYRTGFRAAVHETVAAACNQLLYGIQSPPPGVTHKNLASARFVGADHAMTKAAGLTLTASDAEAIVEGRLEIAPPQPARNWAGAPPPTLASRIVDRYLGITLRPDAWRAIDEAIDNAWMQGRDDVWQPATRAAALRSVGRNDEAQAIEDLNEARWHLLEEAAGPYPSQALPYIRPTPPAAVAAHTGRRTAPEGWVVEPVRWDDMACEAVYNPTAFEIAVAAPDGASMGDVGWELRATAEGQGFWIRDTATATRAALHRLDRPVAKPPPEAEPPGLGP